MTRGSVLRRISSIVLRAVVLLALAGCDDRGGDRDGLQDVPLAAHHDALVMPALHPDHGLDGDEFLLLREFLYGHRDPVRELVTEPVDKLFPQELRGKEPFITIGHLVGGVQRRSLRQQAAHGFFQLVDVVPGLRGQRDDLPDTRLAGDLADEGQEPGLVLQPVDLVRLARVSLALFVRAGARKADALTGTGRDAIAAAAGETGEIVVRSRFPGRASLGVLPLGRSGTAK